MDIIFIHDLRIDTVIGINDWEREIRQTVRLDIEMGTDIRPAAHSTEILQTIDYKAVSKRVVQFISSSECLLVETLAEQTAALIREEFQVPWVKLTLYKLGAVRGSQSVGIIIERGQRF